jgi:hypothetical protein
MFAKFIDKKGNAVFVADEAIVAVHSTTTDPAKPTALVVTAGYSFEIAQDAEEFVTAGGEYKPPKADKS